MVDQDTNAVHDLLNHILRAMGGDMDRALAEARRLLADARNGDVDRAILACRDFAESVRHNAGNRLDLELETLEASLVALR